MRNTRTIELLSSLLTVLFIGLKLTNYIDWSWWIVLSPIWGAILIGLIYVFGVAYILQLRINRSKKKYKEFVASGKIKETRWHKKLDEIRAKTK